MLAAHSKPAATVAHISFFPFQVPVTLCRPCIHTPRRLLPVCASTEPAASTSATPVPAATKDTVTVLFRQTGKATEAKPGEDMLDAAARCDADAVIQLGCFSGSCGVCEVELFKWNTDGTQGARARVLGTGRCKLAAAMLAWRCGCMHTACPCLPCMHPTPPPRRWPLKGVC